MDRFKNIFRLSIVVALALSFGACTSGGGDDGGSGKKEQQSKGDAEFTTDCGTVINGELINPVKESEGILVSIIEAITHNIFILELADGGQFLMKLHGISNDVSEVQATKASSLIQGLGKKAIFYKATEDCQTSFPGGGLGTMGALFNGGGVSFAQRLLKQGGAEASTDACGGDLIAACYNALEEQGAAKAPPTGASVSNFLWKPASERDGKLVILFNPGGAAVQVNGTTLTNTGSSNGRGTTARANQSGCAFGANVVVTAKDKQGRALVFPGGATSYTIPNGCNRVEF